MNIHIAEIEYLHPDSPDYIDGPLTLLWENMKRERVVLHRAGRAPEIMCASDIIMVAKDVDKSRAVWRNFDIGERDRLLAFINL